MDDYISKPVRLATVVSILEKAAAGRQDEHRNAAAEDTQPASRFQEYLNRFVAETDLSVANAEKYFNEYALTLPDYIREIRSALEQDDFAAARHLAHQLKEVSANLRIDPVYALSIALEQVLLEQDTVASVALLAKTGALEEDS